ncbi:O-antigen ligase family protein [Nocardioides sp. CN2-186]|uniref:O-antigen ligase family protein n=1 Tax=Nocardioides tweenelious TaxID=3156607 RepID=UPI0032B4520A
MTPTIVAGLLAALLVAAPKVRPYAVLAFVVLVEQELVPGGHLNDTGPLVSTGANWYYADTNVGVPAVTALSVALILMCWSSARKTGSGAIAIGVVCLISWVIILGASQGDAMRDDLASIQTLVLLLAAYLSACWLSANDSRDSRQSFRLVLYGLVIAKAMVGVTVLAAGQGPQHDGEIPIAFYDSVPLLIAGGAATVAAFDRSSKPWIRNVALVGAMVLGGVSVRRASLVGVVLVLILGLVAARRASAYLRIGAVVAVSFVIAIYALPSAMQDITGSIGGAIDGVLGNDSADTSTLSHLRDNQAGMHLVLTSPVEGVGVRARPTVGFVVQQGDLLYVHNEFLYAWLHFGIVGLLGILGLIAYSVVCALSVLARRDQGGAPPWALFGSAVLIGCLPGYWFFPHLLTLDRFALLFGWSLGAVVSSLPAMREKSLSSVGALERSVRGPRRPEGRSS